MQLRMRGVVALETALGLPVLLFAICLWCEICFVSYIGAMLDYALAETSRYVRAYPHKDYAAEFARIFNASNSVWQQFIDSDKLILKVSYQKDLAMLEESHCQDRTLCFSSVQKKSLIAVYQVSYPYRPLFSQFTFETIPIPVLKREIIAVQEYER